MTTTSTTATYTVKNAFIFASNLNVAKSYSGRQNQEVELAESFLREIKELVSEGSLAAKILADFNPITRTLSDKQIWVIAYELMKNNDWVAEKTEQVNSELRAKAAKKARKAAKVVSIAA